MGKVKLRLLNRKIHLRKSVVLFLAAISILLYVALIPASSLFYDYVPNEKIIADIVPAPSNATKESKTPLCPIVPPNLDKVIDINLNPNLVTLAEDYKILGGGAWRPTTCIARHRVAIVVPYKNRQWQLHIFLYHMHSFLRKQLLDYRIFIIEQSSRLQLNRAALFNVGYVESLKISNFHCYIFHDVDLLPMNTANMYACSQNPRHMTVSINVFRFNLLYKLMFGGAIAMTAQQFEAINGCSNSFFGWGGEDDDLANRILNKGMKISRWDPSVSRYHMLRHVKEMPNDDRHLLLKTGERKYDSEGLNTLEYSVIDHQERDLYTWILVDFPDADHG